ncbi:MAG: Type 1 glutamine amidotransferase-like domain-containing protein [Candidatus Pacebacteria bacterium]|nr:Type 1 glutamine amidotransferase-like domain-containing protein [Candidatus Paceibacterota bacterium]
MKLYLTSNGLEDRYVADYFRKIVLSEDLENTSFLIVSVQDSESDSFYLQKTKDELRRIGAVDIDVFELRDKEFVTTKEYDVIYVCGGNTFAYLDRIKRTGLDEFITNSVRSNRSIYVGVSAGSIVAGPDIELSGWGSNGDTNDIGLKDLKGLGLTDVLTYPHYSIQEEEGLKEFEKQNGYKIMRLTDSQALFIDNDAISIVSQSIQ